MKRKLFLPVLLFISLVSFSQSKLGDVACVYITSSNLDSSAALYEKLGFKKINSNTYPIPWSQLSDGSLLIMMRQDATPYIGLTYYSNDLDKTVSELEKAGIEFSQKPKETDPIKRYYIKTPDGFNIVLSNNLGGFAQPTGKTMLNMKAEEFQSAEKYPNKQCGAFGEFCHPVIDLENSIAFWKKLGFEVKSNMKQPYPYAILSDGLMLIGLHQTKDFNYPAVTYFGLNTEKRLQQLKENGVRNFTEMMGKNNVILTTWEGQHVFLFSMGM
jgi:glyoxalase/bleomycin resistance protein/dioxygenase superfamily protein